MRRFAALVNGLPGSARVWNEENGGWGPLEHLVARGVEETNLVFRQVAASIPSRNPIRHKPLVIPRPGANRKPNKSWIREWATAAVKR